MHLKTLSASLALGLFLVPAYAQTADPAKEFAKAAELYYTPTAKGLRTIRCDVGMNWKSLIENASGTKLPDDSPIMAYFNTIHLSIFDTLESGGDITWSVSGAAPEGLAEPLGLMQQGITTAWHGFFQAWNEFMNGHMVTVTDDKTTVEREAAGFRLSAQDGDTLVEEHYDARLLLLNMHVAAPQMDITLTPTFTDTPQGKIMTVLDTKPGKGTDPSAASTIYLKYAPVSGYQIPSEVRMVASGQNLVFTLTGCAVNTIPEPVKVAGK